MPRVGFDQLSPRKYEDMVSVLLSREIQTHRLDGTGGSEVCVGTLTVLPTMTGDQPEP